MKLVKVTQLPGQRDTDSILKVTVSTVEVTDNFAGGGIPIDGSLLQTV